MRVEWWDDIPTLDKSLFKEWCNKMYDNNLIVVVCNPLIE